MKKSAVRTIETPIGMFSPPSIGTGQSYVPAPRQPGEVVPMDEVVGQTLTGLPAMNGQTISVNVAAASPHLSFGEWMKRGILSALGNGLLFFPRLMGRLLEAVLMGVIGLAKAAALILLIPTLIWAGYMLQQHLSKAESVREGAASATVQGGEVLKGIADGAKAEKDPLAGKAQKADK